MEGCGPGLCREAIQWRGKEDVARKYSVNVSLTSVPKTLGVSRSVDTRPTCVRLKHVSVCTSKPRACFCDQNRKQKCTRLKFPYCWLALGFLPNPNQALDDDPLRRGQGSDPFVLVIDSIRGNKLFHRSWCFPFGEHVALCLLPIKIRSRILFFNILVGTV